MEHSDVGQHHHGPQQVLYQQTQQMIQQACHQVHQQQALQEYRELVQQVPVQFCCHECGLVFESRTSLDNHLKVHTSNYTTDWHPSTTQYDVSYDAEETSGETLNAKRETTYASLELMSMPRMLMQCDKCGYICTVNEFAEHEAIHHPFSDDKELRPATSDLQNVHHQGKENQYQGHASPKKSLGYTPFYLSKVIPDQEKTVLSQLSVNHATRRCKVCNLWFPNEEQRCSHYETAEHETGLANMKEHRSKKSVYCAECDKTFSKPGYLLQHIRSRHSGPKPYRCKDCGKSFSEENLLQEHVYKHVADKPHKCEDCPKQYVHISDLKRHRLKHACSQRYTCYHCGKEYVRRDHFLMHFKTHKEVSSS